MIPRKGSPVPLSTVIEKILDDSNVSKYGQELKLKAGWEKIFGTRLAQVMQLVEFKPPVIKVKVESAVWVMELRFKKQEITQKINEFLRGNLVQEIVFV